MIPDPNSRRASHAESLGFPREPNVFGQNWYPASQKKPARFARRNVTRHGPSRIRGHLRFLNILSFLLNICYFKIEGGFVISNDSRTGWEKRGSPFLSSIFASGLLRKVTHFQKLQTSSSHPLQKSPTSGNHTLPEFTYFQ